MLLDALPLGVTGKLDRRALPAPEFASSSGFREPVTATEEIVAGIFADLTGGARVGADDSFFEVGGNSLSATRAMARINEAFGTALTVREFFEVPTVSALASRVDAHVGLDRPRLTASERPARIPSAPAQERIWFDNQRTRGGEWNIPFALRLHGAIDVTVLRAAAGDVVARHESLRTVYPATADGPVQVIVPAEDAIPQVEVVDVDPASLDAGLNAFLWGQFRRRRRAADADAVVPHRTGRLCARRRRAPRLG
ncbi:phosphopantetheine-binding protein [Prescottella defluvii]|nr:phosphopantetheine-binding protein [Prescottella defluvii]